MKKSPSPLRNNQKSLNTNFWFSIKNPKKKYISLYFLIFPVVGLYSPFKGSYYLPIVSPEAPPRLNRDIKLHLVNPAKLVKPYLHALLLGKMNMFKSPFKGPFEGNKREYQRLFSKFHNFHSSSLEPAPKVWKPKSRSKKFGLYFCCAKNEKYVF